MRQRRFTASLWIGSLFFVVGLVGDCIVGFMLLNEIGVFLLLLHILMMLLWILGICLITQPQAKARTNKWIIVALFLGMAIFPGLGSLSYSIALGYAYFFRPRNIAEVSTPLRGGGLIEEPLLEDSEEEQQPLLDILRFANLEIRRAAVAAMGQQITPRRALLLRHLLTDPQAEIRSDASVILTRLEEKLAQELHVAHEVWKTDPTDSKHTLYLVDQYYSYATSNVLDEASQQIYLLKARDLLLQVISEEVASAEYWYKLAQMRHLLGEDQLALQDALTSFRLAPDLHSAYQLACDLAFSQHDWKVLHTLAQSNKGQQNETAIQNVLQLLELGLEATTQVVQEVQRG